MAQMTFSPEKCEQVGAVYYSCGSEHALPDASSDSGKTNDARLIRGVCEPGYHYEAGDVTGEVCQKD